MKQAKREAKKKAKKKAKQEDKHLTSEESRESQRLGIEYKSFSRLDPQATVTTAATKRYHKNTGRRIAGFAPTAVRLTLTGIPLKLARLSATLPDYWQSKRSQGSKTRAPPPAQRGKCASIPVRPSIRDWRRTPDLLRHTDIQSQLSVVLGILNI